MPAFSIGYASLPSCSEETVEPFVTAPVEEDDDEHFNDDFRALAETIFGETREKQESLLAELQEVLEERSIRITSSRSFCLKMLRAGEDLPFLLFPWP